MRATFIIPIVVITVLFLGCESDSAVEPAASGASSYWDWAPVYVAGGSGVGPYYAHKYRDCEMIRYVKSPFRYRSYKYAVEDITTGAKIPCWKCQARARDGEH
jgi:hypothetical protein